MSSNFTRATLDDENRLDFELLKQQLSNASSDQTINSVDSEIWPLKLKPMFIDHYILGDIIGSGSFAEVRECISMHSLERCAVKIVNQDYLKRQAPYAMQNQLQEIQLLRRINHANVISMRECLFRSSKIYIILEHCTFVLSELIEGQQDLKLCQSVVKNLFHQLIKGLSYIHSVGIIHRDIKPQNLLVKNCGLLKIIDFGVSHLLSIWTRDDTCSNYEGSPLFQAPEVVSGQLNYAGYKVDVWSAGVTLYLMLFGKYPFMDETLLGLHEKIMNQRMSLPRNSECLLECHCILEDLLNLMLEKESTQRIAIDMILSHPWLKTNDDYTIVENELTEFAARFSKANQSNQTLDVYRSMSVLPYLHSYYFPDLTVTKARRASGSATSSTTSSTSPLDSSAFSPTIFSNSVDAAEPKVESSTLDSPHEVISDTVIEWGTEKQFKLLKVPSVRVNRVKSKGKRFNRMRCKEKRKSALSPSIVSDW